jgi:hypothetical protein
MNNQQLKPSQCCEEGSCQCEVPMPLNGCVQGIDYCVADIVAALNAAGIETMMSCCGHGKRQAELILADGRDLQWYVTPKGQP